ncbi:MAG TPA: hypothetical protein VGS07_30305 [Thermoanaerobaculia bacterium]|jgi:hypothetical protein|nr:hypothetical protein [Thermoanaerobaculia bacterium]
MSVKPLDAQDAFARARFGVWPENADRDGVLGEVDKALDATIATWADVRTAYRSKLLDLTATPYGRVKAAATYMTPKVGAAFSRLDRVTASIKRELSALDAKHKPKLGGIAETMMETEVRSYLRRLPESSLMSKLMEAVAQGDTVTLRAALLAPPTLLTIPEGLRMVMEDGYARSVDPGGFAHRELLERAAALVQRSGTALIEETQKLLPGWIEQAQAHDQRAAGVAQRLVERETAMAVVESRLEPREEESLVLRPRTVPISLE